MDAQQKAKPRCPCCGIDAHAHWFPPEWMDLLEREGPRHGVVLGKNHKGHRTAEGGGLPFKQTFASDMIDLDCAVDSMKAARLDMRILSLTNPMVFWAPDSLGAELARTFNDAMGSAVRKYPSQIRGAITLPLQSPTLALKELERAADIPGMCCAYSAMHINGINVGDKSFWPLYEFCAEKNLPLCLHPVAPCGSEDRLADFHMRNIVGNPHESAIGAASLILGGALDTFPNLKIMMPHAGGSFPWLVGRWDNGIARRPELAHMKQPASAYMRRFHYDTINHDAPALRFLIDRIGADRFVLGTDYNMDAGVELPVDFIEEIPGITEAELRLVARDNVMSLFDLSLPQTVARQQVRL